MTKLKRIICALVCATLLAPALAAAEGGQGILYHVTGGRNDMYLLGSIHIGNENMYPVSDSILSALNGADVLVMECDTDSGDATGKILSMMSYPIGETLKQNVSEETYALLEEAAQQSGYLMAMLNGLRPWAVTSMFAVQSTAAEMGVADISEAMALGVETQLGALAGDKPRAYLETAVEQLTIMDSLSPELQEYMLNVTLKSIVRPGEYTQPGDEGIASWSDWWRDGKAELFADSYLTGMEQEPEKELMQEYHDKMLSQRNMVMALGLRELLESDESHSLFAIVGLLHLVLPNDSVVYLLQDMGYAVERVG